MKMLVCVKQVPDTDAPIAVDVSGRWVASPGLTFRMNRFDEYAVEEALLIKEDFPASTIDAVTVGPARSLAAVKRALEMGADNGVHIVLSEDAYVLPSVIATHIRNYAQEKAYDLILCGAMSEDFMHGQMGPLLAALLERPSITAVIAARVSADGSRLSVEQEIEGGLRRLYELQLPAVLSVQTGINHPRYPTLTNVLRAKRQEIQRIDAPAISSGSRVAFRLAPPCSQGIMIAGSLYDKAREMLRILHAQALL
jgi:electron transfer flavoprotein beta subunit